jgi:hypothetical protein
MSSAEAGQATVVAVIHALHTSYPGLVDLHPGSFTALGPRTSPNVTFHTIAGKSMRGTGVWVDRESKYRV